MITADNIYISASLSVLFFIYYQIITFLIGFIVTPFKSYLSDSSYKNIFIFWLAGFNALCGIMILTGCFWHIDVRTVFLLNLILWVVVFIKRNFLILYIPRFITVNTEWIRDKRLYIFLIPLLIIIVCMLFSCLVPPTKADELSYGIYYTKKAVLEGNFARLYSPLPALTYMAVPTYNIWPYVYGAEYTPALNSLLYYVFAVFFIFSWSRQRFGQDTAIVAGLISAFCLQKVVCSIAPGDNTLNFLLLAVLMITSYDFYTASINKDKINSINKIGAEFFMLYLVFFTAIAVKWTSVLLITPVIFFLYIFLFKKAVFPKSHLIIAGSAFLFLIPFLIREHILYGNFIFPFGVSLLGSGPFEPDALAEGIRVHLADRLSPIHAGRDFMGLLKSYFLYIRSDILFMNPLSWILIILGYIHLFRVRAYYAALALAVCYVSAFYMLMHYFMRHYLGAMDFLIVLGTVELFRLFKGKIRDVCVRSVKALAAFAAFLVTCAAILYTWQFAYCFFSGQDRDDFIRPRVECYDTVKWVNENLPEDALLLVPTRSRYYYNVSTESFNPTVLGRGKEIIGNSRGFYEFLKAKGVTHAMTAKRSIDKSKSPYELFCEDKKFNQLIYQNNNEIVMAGRHIKPQYGKTAIYRVK